MDTTFINSENSKTSKLCKLVFNLSHNINFKINGKYVHCQILISVTYRKT